jgi:hypothetical protein
MNEPARDAHIGPSKPPTDAALAQWRARYTPNAPTLPVALPPDVRHFLERI